MFRTLFIVKNKDEIKNHIDFFSKNSGSIKVIENYEEFASIKNIYLYDVIIANTKINNREIDDFINQLTLTDSKPPLLVAITDINLNYESIYALKAGAINIVHKEESPKLWYFKIQSLFSTINSSPITQYTFLKLNYDNFTASFNNKSINLSAKEFKLLFFLSSQNGSICYRETIVDTFWPHTKSSSRILDVYIRNIRIKTSNDVIESVRGVGYRLNKKYVTQE
jgi:DNA-binding response OmpR family regulator